MFHDRTATFNDAVRDDLHCFSFEQSIHFGDVYFGQRVLSWIQKVLHDNMAGDPA